MVARGIPGDAIAVVNVVEFVVTRIVAGEPPAPSFIQSNLDFESLRLCPATPKEFGRFPTRSRLIGGRP